MLLMKMFSLLDKSCENKKAFVNCYTAVFGLLLVSSLCGISKYCAIALFAMVADLFVAISTQ